jgi:hypothetical protein
MVHLLGEFTALFQQARQYLKGIISFRKEPHIPGTDRN